MLRILSIISICIFGVAVLWIATSDWGIGYDPDSIIYEDVAENWLDGYGLARFEFETGARYPLTNFPPLYPIILALLSRIFGSVAQSARVLNTAMWCLMWLINYLWICRERPKNHRSAWIFATLLMINFFVFQLYGTSWSEPLFMVLVYSGLWLFVTYCRKDAWRYLIVAGLIFGFATLTRYAGVAVIATAMLSLLLMRDKALLARFKSILLLGMVSGLPLILWFVRNVSVRGDVANRNLGFTLPGIPQLESTLLTLGDWLVPISNLSLNLPILMIVVGLLSVSFWQSREQSAEADIVSAIVSRWFAIYILFILGSFMFVDPRIPFNYRLLLPAYVALIILIGRWFGLHFAGWGRVLRVVWVSLAIALVCVNVIMSLFWMSTIWSNGHQYSSRVYQQSPFLAEIRENSEPTNYITNNNFLLHYHTGKPADSLPFPNEDGYDSWIEEMATRDHLQIVFFHWLGGRGWESAEQLEAELPLILVEQGRDLNIYTIENDDE